MRFDKVSKLYAFDITPRINTLVSVSGSNFKKLFFNSATLLLHAGFHGPLCIGDCERTLAIFSRLQPAIFFQKL